MIGLRVALVCPYSWTVPGGVQSHIAGLARYLRDQGAAVAVYSPCDGPAPEGVVPLGRTVGFPDNGSVTRIALGPAAVLRTVKAVRGRVDIVHVHEPMLPAAGVTAVVAARAPVVATFHMAAERAGWYRLFTPVVRAAARRLRAKIAVSRAAQRCVSQVIPGPYHLIPNGIQVDAHAGVRASGPGRRITFVGRPDPRKGLDVLLEAFRRLGATGARLDLVGVRGDEIHGEPALGGTIRAHGRVSDEVRARIVARSDVVCVPSLGSESFGMVLAEAMAVGVPVVASAIPGYADTLPRGCGRLVPPGDPAALARALGDLLEDGALRSRMGEAAARAARRFDWSEVGPVIVDVYRQALDRPPAR